MNAKIWPHANAQQPCPICHKIDWCTFGDRAALCQRVESPHPAKNGGWYHFFEDIPNAKPLIVAPKKEPKQIDAAKMMRRWYSNTHRSQYEELASSIKVAADSLVDLGAGWSPEHKAWAFPMFDGDNNVIGIRLRNLDGDKWAITGSRQGIFQPEYWDGDSNICYLPEGPTDTAALLSLGLFAIGRPTCNGGNDMIKEALRRLQIFRVVIVSDNDEIKATGKRPGLEGAMKLKKELGLASVIWMPPSPCKDVREFVRNNGASARTQIESDINQKVWNKT
jgi:hypothetical protein